MAKSKTRFLVRITDDEVGKRWWVKKTGPEGEVQSPALPSEDDLFGWVMANGGEAEQVEYEQVLKACTVCGVPSKTGRCKRHPFKRSPSSQATGTRAHRRRRAALIAEADELRCGSCGKPLTPDEVDAHHVVDVAKGGEQGKLAIRCASCNRGDGGREGGRRPR